jgi:sulfate adenylyltransferase
VDVGFAAYFEELGRVGLVTDNPGKTVVSISGTKMRELLDQGQMPDERVMRPSTAKVLAAYYQTLGR